MSDIDFEELDKAINKAAGTDSEQKLAEEVREDSSENLNDNQEVSDTSKKDINLEDQNDDEEESDRKVVPHREGRFLDMVHPSADMSLSPSSFSPSQSITKIDPVDNDLSDEKDEKEPVSTEGDNQSEETVDESSGNDLAEKVDKEPEEKPIEQSPPAESPFIEGSEKKVSKRPLGGWNQDDQQPEKLDANEDDENTNADNRGIGKSEEIILPPELEKELVEIEETNQFNSQKSEIDESLSKKLDDELASHEDTLKPESNSSSEHISGLLESGKDASEQYKVDGVKDESSKEELHPLFADGHNSHVAVPKKAASKGMKILRWTVTIVGLIMLGVIIGVSIFFFITGGSGL